MSCRWISGLPVSLIVIALLAGAMQEASLAGPAPRGPNSKRVLEQVIVVFKTHFDIGYTDLASNVIDRYRTSMIDKALAACDASRDLPPEHRFVWTLSGWPMAQVLWPGQDPTRRKRIEEAIRQGQLVWHGLPATTHTESLDLEDLVRGMRFSSQLSREFSMPLPRDAKMTDVPSHTWILPTVLRHAGIQFLHLGCNSASASPELPRLFWWEGPDGSRLLTMYEASGYGSGIRPPKDWPHRTWLGLIHTGDNHGPPKPDEVKQLVDKARKELPGVKIRMGRLSDFADAILQEDPELPIVRADTPDTWIHGIMSMPAETQMARQLRQRTAALETLTTLRGAWGSKTLPTSDTVAAAYEGTLMFGEHTWGYSMSPFGYHYGKEWAAKRSQGHYERLERSWVEKGAWIHDAKAAVEPALSQNLSLLGGAVRVDGPRIVVFNPLPWERNDVVSVNVASGTCAGLKDLASGASVPVEADGNTIRFAAQNVPPMGYRTYVPADQRDAGRQLIVDESSSVIENQRYRVRMDPSRGIVASIRDKLTDRELIDGESPYGLGQYLYERFDTANIQRYFDEYLKYVPGWVAHFARANMAPADQAPHVASSPHSFTLRLQRNELSVSALMTAGAEREAAERVSLRVTLYDDQPYVDLTWAIHNKKPDQWPEAGWLCVPLSVDKPKYRLGRLGSIVDPVKDVAKGSNCDVFCLSSGMTVSGTEPGCIGLCPVDSPLVSIGRPGLYRHTGRFRDRQPVLFVNLFNNVWGTNFQQWTSGSWSSGLRLWSSADDQVEADLLTPSWEARSSCLATYVDGPAGTLPPVQPGLSLSRKGVLMTAFGRNPDGDGLLLRLWEQAGRDGPCDVRLPEGLQATKAQPCDLRGRAQGPSMPIENGWLKLTLQPFAPASFLLH